MKTLTQIFFIFAFSHLCIAQKFYPYPDSNCVWSVSTLNYFVKGDSIVNSQKYQKYFYTPDSTLLTNVTYWGLIRNDTSQKKIFFKGGLNPGTEKLLYNYNFSLHDTLPPYTLSYNQKYSALILSVDSVLVSGSYRKRWGMRAIYPDFGYAQWIEGVGSTRGPLRTGFEFWNYFDYVDNDFLLCLHINGVLVYPAGLSTGCYYLPVNINEYSKDAKFVSIYPTLAQDVLYIAFVAEMKSSSTNYQYTICDYKGSVLRSFSESRKTFEVPIGDLSPGIYVIEIRSGSKSLGRKKFVKQ
ncbi:MAG: hypothetical protein PSX36_10880 [bacterium]|nr:hypothetical protein [bacterium]